MLNSRFLVANNFRCNIDYENKTLPNVDPSVPIETVVSSQDGNENSKREIKERHGNEAAIVVFLATRGSIIRLSYPDRSAYFTLH
jgi:hypothetical protein